MTAPCSWPQFLPLTAETMSARPPMRQAPRPGEPSWWSMVSRDLRVGDGLYIPPSGTQDAQVRRHHLPRAQELTVGQAASHPGLLFNDLPGKFVSKIYQAPPSENTTRGSFPGDHDNRL